MNWSVIIDDFTREHILQLGRLHPRILEACVHEKEQLAQLLQYGDAFFQRNHFVGGHEDRRHDEKSPVIETES
jgi:c-di-GMP-related signal transduction protein